jgi:hypothetical protein
MSPTADDDDLSDRGPEGDEIWLGLNRGVWETAASVLLMAALGAVLYWAFHLLVR